MQKLHLVGFTPDHDGLILSARKGAKSGKFVVSVDTVRPFPKNTTVESTGRVGYMFVIR